MEGREWGSVCTCMYEKEREQRGKSREAVGRGDGGGGGGEGCCMYVYMHVIERGGVKEVGGGEREQVGHQVSKNFI